MKIKIILFAICLFFYADLPAQIFISKGKIEYEVKSDIRKTMGNNTWEEMLKDKLPRFKTGYYALTFAGNKSLYQFDHWGAPKLPDFMTSGDENEKYFYNYNSGIYNIQKNVEGSNINISDSIPKLKWKLVNEYRVIAGFNCRKAYAVMLDSVYVFAFYTEEITVPGGPASFHGLPGTILGVTVPRLYTSWIATKVEVNGIDVNAIKPVDAKKNISMSDLKSLIIDRTKDWYSDEDASENKELQQQKARFIWETLL
ncbi:MAG TPA: GLPGLI family protein [Hanamia sp.]|nr:GLPGLI family protein [Hanamia sp.]